MLIPDAVRRDFEGAKKAREKAAAAFCLAKSEESRLPYNLDEYKRMVAFDNDMQAALEEARVEAEAVAEACAAEEANDAKETQGD